MSWDVKDADEKFKDLSARGIVCLVLQTAECLLSWRFRFAGSSDPPK
ncbi:MAG: hypothetical protein LW832_05230 [Parachlamydia sp.]|nr:hypothetical protein [Parachlamydia sp.]